MVDVFQKALLYVALVGLAFLLPILVAKSKTILLIQSRLLNYWRSLSPFGRIAVMSFLTASILYGGSKQGGEKCLNVRMFECLNERKVLSYAQKKAQNWNIRGAWKDSFWLKFADGWRFPYGTNHLYGVEVISFGELWQTPFENNAIVSLGAPVEIVPTLSSFLYEFTPSNSYRFVWENAAIRRNTNNLLTASLELFRNGDACIVTNGVETYKERELPFHHDGFGQDDEWVRANFTNATEILSIGYHDWVDEQVGVGLENGLYKFMVKLNEIPPEAIQLCVGDFSVAVTNKGEYVFLLEKGEEYQFGTIPFFNSVEYAFVDDINNSQKNGTQSIKSRNNKSSFGVWTTDSGVDVTYPSEAMLYGSIIWLPLLQGWPNVKHLNPGEFPKTFSGLLLDYRGDIASVAYEWRSGSDDINIASSNMPSTLVSVDVMPRWSEFFLSVTVKIAGRELTSILNGSYGLNQFPGVYCSIDLQDDLILCDKWLEGSRSAVATIAFESDIATNGCLRVRMLQGGDRIKTNVALPKEVYLYMSNSYQHKITVDGIIPSEAMGDVIFRCEFIDDEGNVGNYFDKTITVIDPLEVIIPSAPTKGMCVVKDSYVGVSLKTVPDVYFTTNVEWHTAQRRYNKKYDSWVKKGIGGTDALLLMATPGVFALKARLICGVQSNETVYVHKESEPYCEAIKEELGPCNIGDRNHVGVARSAALLSLRNAAIEYLGVAEYGYLMTLSSKNGFSRVGEGKWKCNRFVADVAIEAGFEVPHNQTSHLFGGTYPPVANDWATGRNIGEWIHLGSVYPEPGFLAARENPNGQGHCGIVDYDGWVISARPDGVGRNAEKMLDQIIKYNIPKE